MNIKILKLILKNFKGTKSLIADFKGEYAAIKGDNGTGKSTINDAFTWVLFDKNSAGNKTFNIKTLDKLNQTIHGLDHEVTAILLVDEKEITLKKSYKETWTKRRGEAEKTMTGHTTDYFINEIPSKKAEYEAYIHNLVDEKIFKLITSPLEFNNLAWKERRTALLEIVGDVTDSNVIDSDEKLKRLGGLLGDRKVEDFKKLISSKKKMLNDEIKSIPYRVDELVSSVDIEGTDFTEKENEIAKLENEITEIDFKVMDQSSIYKENNIKSSKVYEIKNKLRVIEATEASNAGAPRVAREKQINSLKGEISNLNYRIDDGKRKIKQFEGNVEDKKAEKQELTDKWNLKKAETLIFSERDFKCPTCNREFDEDKADDKKSEMLNFFDKTKEFRLGEISKVGKALKASIEGFEKRISEVIEEIQNLSVELDAKQTELESINPVEAAEYTFEKTPEYLSLEKEIATLEASIKEPNTEYLDSLKADKRAKEREIDSLKAEINQKAQFEKNQLRIIELQDREKELGSMIADLEGQEFLCETFIRTKVDMLEGKINSKFKNVNFKLFETQVNGALNEICEILVNGVPFNEANLGGKINGGLDIINTLCAHYDVYAPIFIDNRESITQIINTKSQVINLVVEKGLKLTIEGAE